ncbi:MAG TPA: DUF190 domain-containing protein [Burkholderiales bacterium]|nr:DUF190 domain-containing protein [Burkholderiales bacterium]
MGVVRGVCLKIYVSEAQQHDGELLYEWLVERARGLGVPGASVFRAIAGYGRHGKLHEEGFFELAGNVPVEVEFLVSAIQAERLLRLLSDEGLRLFYVKLPAEFSIVGES